MFLRFPAAVLFSRGVSKTALLGMMAVRAIGGPLPDVRINEIRIDQTSTDIDEYFELAGPPNFSLDDLTYLVIGDGGASDGSGVIEEVTNLDGNALSAGGYFVAAESSFTLGTANLTVDLNFENSDNVTHLLVTGFSGSNNLDLDTNDDGILDETPWDQIVDLVAILEEPNPPSGTEYHYGPPIVGPDGSTIGHVFRCGGSWTIGPFNPVGGLDTPGSANSCSGDGCGGPATLIHDIQGSGPTSPMEGATDVIVEGIVIGDYQDVANQWGGFYMQEEDSDADADPMTSEGIFVYTGAFEADVDVGDKVRVQGEVLEFFGLTEISNVTMLTICSSGEPPPTASVIDLPVSDLTEWESYEGMLVSIPEPLTVTDSFWLGRFGEAHLSVDGRLFRPTGVVEPGPAALDLQELNHRSRILLDDGSGMQNPDPALPPIPRLADGETLRAGDTIDGITGILDFRMGRYRLQPVQPPIFLTANPRPASPPPVGGSLKVASFNLNNYFTTLDTGAPICGPSGDADCRGADSAAELTRQRDKLLAALAGLDADIVGLVEIENNATAAIQDLVDGLNSVLGAGTYAFIDTGTIGTDVVKCAVIYRPGVVTPVGDFAILDSTVDPLFIDNLNRPVLAQTFEEVATGERLTAAVNHFKSKSSPCDPVGDPDTGDGQENCNGTRTNAATALASWLATDPTGSGDPDFLILGDLNSYSLEDPVAAILDAGYANLIAEFVGPEAYTFVLDGEAGALDYALSSASLFSQVEGATLWHINADEPGAFDYNTEFNHPSYYSTDPFRASDHDPILVGLRLGEPPTNTPTNSPTPTVTNTPSPTDTAPPTSTPTPTLSSTPSDTPTPEPTPTSTRTPTLSPTPTPTATPTRSPTATPTRNGPLIDFDLLLNNQVLDEEFADLGVRFHSTARVLSTDSAPTPRNVIQNIGDAITATFLDPISSSPGVTRFVGFKKPAGTLPGTSFEIYDAEENLLDQRISQVLSQESFAFHQSGIARLVCRAIGPGILVAIDDLEFDTPREPLDFDEDGDDRVTAKDLLILIGDIKAGLEDYSVLFRVSPLWYTDDRP
jgi:hypothetical protein